MRAIADYHTHTNWSHGMGTVVANVQAAAERGLEAVGIAEHGPNLLFVGVAQRQWPRLRQQIRGLDCRSPRLLFNIEANVISLAGDLDLPRASEDVDMLLVGLHPRIIPGDLQSFWAFYGLRYLALLSRRQRHLFYDSFTAAMINCVNKYQVDVVVHPGYGLPIDTRELAQACARRGTRFEINCQRAQASVKDIKIAASVQDVEFVLGSDAHKPQDVGNFDAGYRLVRELHIARERVVNVRW